MTPLKETINRLEPYIQDYLTGLGIHKPLFNCLNPAHPDRHPSMSYIKQSYKVYCHACKVHYSIIDLLGIELGYGPSPKGKDFIEVLKYGCQKYNIPFPETENKKNIPKPYLEQCYNNRNKTDYFKKRGINKATIKKFRLGYDENFKLENGKTMKAIIIPTSNSTYTARNTENNKTTRYRRSPGPTQLFNISALKRNQPTFIVEGEIDLLTLAQTGCNTVALSGVENIKKLTAACIEYSFPNMLLIALDNDERGKNNAIKLKEELDKYKIRNRIITPYGKYKDANEAYLQEQVDFVLRLSTELKETLKENKLEEDCKKLVEYYKNATPETRLKINSILKEYC